MSKAVCLVSGGLDSCVTAALARERGFDLAFLHVSYGQLTQNRELRAFRQIAEFYDVFERLEVDGGYLRRIGGSALTDPDIPLPEGRVERTGIPVSYVPFRNANLLSVATSWAEIIKAGFIYVGAVQEDSSGYPDCRDSFFRAFNTVISEGTRPETRIQIVTPLIHWSKAQIVRKGIDLGAPLHLTWSCYQSEQLACGHCDSCLLRLRGFREAGVPDPISYDSLPVSNSGEKTAS